VIQFYEGDWIRGQNIWRRWMVAHNLPRLDGKPIRPFASACNGNHYPGIITNAATELEFMRRYLEEGVQPDFWWEDAGWYTCGDPPDWVNTGTWEVDPSRWPRGIREVSDWCRERNIRTIVWFEPERVAPGTWLSKNHPEWILPGKTASSSGLLNIGDPACRRWITDRIDSVITGQGIDLYRQDFNIDPLPFWRANDGEDRWGITEIRHVEGYLAFWDELKQRHNGMLIDSCASGGRRNDLETLRRAVPLLRSDNIFDPLAEQCHTYGISFWVPFSGTGYMTFDQYLIRSTFGAAMTLGVDTRKKDGDYAMLRKAYADWKKVARCFLGDYYPLTPHSLEKNAWIGWQFDLPETGAGMVQAFRREACLEKTRVLKLRGLTPKATYRVDDLDTGRSVEMPGRTLMEEGFVVEISGQPGSALFSYEKVK
jgi:alpha-galactosidase